MTVTHAKNSELFVFFAVVCEKSVPCFDAYKHQHRLSTRDLGAVRGRDMDACSVITSMALICAVLSCMLEFYTRPVHGRSSMIFGHQVQIDRLTLYQTPCVPD